MRNEAQTRFELIDPMLIDHCGWSRQDIRVEQTAAQIDIVAGKGYRRPAGRTDYLLFRALSEGSEPVPLAIIEAKHTKGYRPSMGSSKESVISAESCIMFRSSFRRTAINSSNTTKRAGSHQKLCR